MTDHQNTTYKQEDFGPSSFVVVVVIAAIVSCSAPSLPRATVRSGDSGTCRQGEFALADDDDDDGLSRDGDTSTDGRTIDGRRHAHPPSVIPGEPQSAPPQHHSLNLTVR
ncbi:unnamed protein product [Soboliphyme baturini]|uniref:Secreted protein n=1 Tax=Soboliphyme baturini TaxID=241478 RepID=A0A183IKZ3_9BILA|nr:unnamed protein product [Soboliphyme baturini]